VLAEAIAAKIVARPWATLLIGVVLTAAGGAGLHQLQPDFSHRGYFADSDPLLQQLDRFEETFGSSDAVVIGVHSPSGIFDVESAELIRELTAAMWDLPEVGRVDSVANFNWVHTSTDGIIVEPLLPKDGPLDATLVADRGRIAQANETVPGYLLSQDGKTTLLFALLETEVGHTPDERAIVLAAREMLERFRRGDHELQMAGSVPLTYAFQEASQADLSVLLPAVGLIAIVLLTVMLRRKKAVAATLLVAVAAIVHTMGLAGWLGVDITNLTGALPQILIAIAVADAVHIWSTFDGGLDEGLPAIEAARQALSKNVAPTLLTSITTAVGFFTFLVSDIKAISGLGLVAGLGTLAAWALTYTLLGPMLVLLELPPRARPGRVRPFVATYANWLGRHRVAVIVALVVGTIGSALAAAQVPIDSNPINYFAEDFHLRVAHDWITERVGAGMGIEIVAHAGEPEGIEDPKFLRKVEDLEDWIDQIPGVTATLSLTGILKEINRAFGGGGAEDYRLPDRRETAAQEILLYSMNLPEGMSLEDRISAESDKLRVTVLWTIEDTAAVDGFVAAIEARANSLGLKIETTGKHLLYQRLNGYVVRSFRASLSAALILVALILCVFLRSVKLGLLSLAPNIFAICAGGFVLERMGQPLDIGTMIVASACFGIAVDDTIHVLESFRRARAGGQDPEAAVAHVLGTTGFALTVTTLVLVCAFGALAFGTFVPTKLFGILAAVVLSAALIADLVLMPALLLTAVRGSD